MSRRDNIAYRTMMGLAVLVGSIGFAANAQESIGGIELRVDAQGFFQNDEYFGAHIQGYTLPGFYLRPRIAWQLGQQAELEVGANWLHYWGAHTYPAGESYGVWPMQDDSLNSRVHLLPWFRATVQLAQQPHRAELTVGDMERSDCHGLPLPLYNPERLYAADPEAGTQLRVDINHLKADVWIDWREFIWQRSSRQERFTFGISARPHTDIHEDDEGRWGVGLPMAFVAQHEGGQGLVERRPVQNHMNAAAGLSVEHDGRHWHQEATLYAMAYRQSNAPNITFDKGWAVFPMAHVDYRWARHEAGIEVGYWHGNDFVPLLGSGLFSSMSAVDGAELGKVQMFSLCARYVWRANRETRVAAEVRYYHYLHEPQAAQYSYGVSIMLSPRLRLTKWN